MLDLGVREADPGPDIGGDAPPRADVGIGVEEPGEDVDAAALDVAAGGKIRARREPAEAARRALIDGHVEAQPRLDVVAHTTTAPDGLLQPQADEWGTIRIGRVEPQAVARLVENRLGEVAAQVPAEADRLGDGGWRGRQKVRGPGCRRQDRQDEAGGQDRFRRTHGPDSGAVRA